MPTRHRLSAKTTLDHSKNPSEEQTSTRIRYQSSSTAVTVSVPKKPPYPDDSTRPVRGGHATRTTKKRTVSQSERLARQFQQRGEVPPEPTPRYLVTPSAATDHAYSSSVGLTPPLSSREEASEYSSLPVSRSRGRSAKGGRVDDEEGPRLHEREPPTYVVGNAILNPYVPVAPTVQQLVQIVPTLLNLPDAALRQPLGGHFEAGPNSGRRPLSAIREAGAAAPLREDVAAAAVAAGETHVKGKSTSSPQPELVASEAAAAAAAPGPQDSAVPLGSSHLSSQIHRLFPSSEEPPPSDGEEFVLEDEPQSCTSERGVSSLLRTSIPSRATDVLPGLDGVTIAPGTQLLCIEEVFGPNGESTAAASALSPAEIEVVGGVVCPPVIRPSVLGLQKLHGTTINDIAVVHGVGGTAPGFVAQEVLPVLAHAEERVQELAAARRLVDWDVTIPTAETIPPPAIAFLDEKGAAVHNVPVVVFTLDSTSLRLAREDVLAPQPVHPTATVVAPAAKVHTNAQSVGKHVTYEDGVHRIHGLIGIMIGLAEKVGLDRVMEYEVQTTSQELFVTSPYVDSETGDLVLQMNSTVQGVIKLVIVGHDCGSVDVDHLEVQKSVNHLECVIKVQYAHDAPNRPNAPTVGAEAQLQPPMNPTSGGVLREDEDGNASFIFAATNPHELRYEECRQATREFVAHKAMRQEQEKQAAFSLMQGGSTSLLSPGSFSVKDAANSGGSLFSPAVANTSMTTANASKTSVAHARDSSVASTENTSMNRLPDSIGPCEPMTTCIAFHMSSFHHLWFFFRLPIWQQMLSLLLLPAPSSTSSSEAAADATESRATVGLFRGMGSFEARQAFIANARGMLGNAVNPETYVISTEPLPVRLRPNGPGVVVANDQNVSLLRDLVLVLALETPRPTRRQFHEVVNLSHRLYHSALLRSLNSTRGTPEGLEQIAQWVILPEAERPAACWRHPLFPDGHLTLQEKERKNLQLLADCLTVALSACFHVGAGAEAIFFATQRVYTLCVLQDGVDLSVCAAQRQLAELYLFYGDYAAAQLAVDALALSEKLCDVDAPELIEAHILCALCHLSANQIEEGMRELNDLFSHVVNRSPHMPPLLACMIQLFVVYAQSSCAQFHEFYPQMVLDDPMPYIDAVLRVISGDHYLLPEAQVGKGNVGGKPPTGTGGRPSASKKKRHSTGKQTAAVPLGDFLRTPSLLEGDAHPTSGQWMRQLFQSSDPRAFLQTSSGTPAEAEAEDFVQRMQASFLTLAGVLLIRAGAHGRGVEILARCAATLQASTTAPPNEEEAHAVQQQHSHAEEEAARREGHSGEPDAVKASPRESAEERVGEDQPFSRASTGEGEGRKANSEIGAVKPEAVQPVLPCGLYNNKDPFGHSERLLSIVSTQAAMWKMWSRPLSLEKCTEVLRSSAVRVEASWGPIHPYTAMVQVLLAQALQNSPHSHALSMARRSLALLRRTVSARSWYFLVAHRTLSRLHTLVHQWKDALEHTNAAMVLAQLNFCTDDIMSQVEEDFIGCLLRCPPGIIVRLNHVRLLSRLQERIARLEAMYGLHAELLVWPIVNLAEVYYMLRDLESALSCLQRAVRLADPKGSLFVTTSTLKPASLLPNKEAVQRRNLMITSVLQTRDRVLQLAQVLFTMAAVLEAMGTISDAQDCYSRCLALLEAAAVESSLSAIRVYTAVAKLLYSSREYGDSLGWARKADRLTHSHYPEWLHESQITRSLLSIVEHRLYAEEGTFVTVNPHNHFDDFVELI